MSKMLIPDIEDDRYYCSECGYEISAIDLIDKLGRDPMNDALACPNCADQEEA